MSANDNNCIEIIRYEIPAASHAAFEQAYDQAGKLLQASPYCRGYSMIKGHEEPDHYLLTIYWTSLDDHLKQFRTSQQFAGFFQLVKPFYNNILEMKHYEPPLIHWQKAV